MRINKLNFLVAGVVCLGMLGGCATLRQNHKDLKKAQSHMSTAPRPKAPSVVEDSNAPYLAGKQIQIRHALPDFFNKQYVLTLGDSTLPEVASKVSQITGIPVYVASDALQSLYSGVRFAQMSKTALSSGGHQLSGAQAASGSGLRISVNWDGTLKGLLDYIASRAGVFWDYEKSTGSVRFYLTKTEVFHIAALPGQMNVNNSISNAGTGGGSSSGGTSGGSSGSGINSSTSQSVSSTTSVDLYKEAATNIKSILKQLSSSGGSSVPTSVSTDSGAGTVTVTATPPVLHQVAKYIDALNSGLTRQAFITVYVYRVQLNAEDNYGLNLGLAFKTANMSFGVSAGGPGTPPATSTLANGSLGLAVVSGRWAKSSLLLKALSTQGSANLVTSASVLALNGQPAPLQVGQTTGYLYSSSAQQAANVGTQTTLTPGSLTTGFSANFLPMILNSQKVLLEYSVNLSNLIKLNTIKSGSSEIQTPDVSSQAFNQRALLHSGQMLVLSGYQSTNDSTNRSGVGSAHNWALGGGYDAQHTKTELVVAIKVNVL